MEAASDANRPPVAAAVADAEVDPGVPVALDGSGSSDPDGDSLTYAWTQSSGATVALAGRAAVRATFTAPVEPGALAFRLTVTDPGGLTDSDAVTVTVRDLVPDFGAASVAALSLTAGEALAAVVLPAATGGNGDLTYTLTSDPAGLAGLSFDAATRTLSGTPSAGGTYTFAYRADDADANTTAADAAVLSFQVTVESVLSAAEAAVKQALQRTLAGVGTRTLTGALANIGSRFADGGAGSSLTLAGRSVPLGLPGGAAGYRGVGADGVCGTGGPAHPGPAGPAAVAPGCAVVDSRGVGADDLLRASAFSVRLGVAADGSGTDSGSPLWSLWGRGDLGSFEGRPEPGARYEGDLRTGWLGFDGRAGAWVAGLAVSHGESEAEYAFDQGGGVAGSGRLETTLTAAYPYGRWTFANGLEVRGVLGAGSGEARHAPDDGAQETGDLDMRLASAGLRRALPALAGFDLAVRADASAVRLETGAGPGFIANVSADHWRVRAGLEASRRFALGDAGGAALVPFVEVAARRDGGDGPAGTGLEVAGGARYEAPGVQVEARGRWLAAHSEDGTREHGVSVTARVGPGAHGRGLSLSLSPRWGAGAVAGALWRDELPRPAAGGADDAGAVDARIGYGVELAPEGLLTPFAELGLAGGESRRLRLGTRFDGRPAALALELAGERRERDDDVARACADARSQAQVLTGR